MSNLKTTKSFSGGLHYHWKACWNKKYWLNFKSNLNEFLMSWNGQRHHLNIVGPSAGYTLSTDFLNCFDQITCYDLDPFAQIFFKKNHKISPHWKSENFFKSETSNINNLLFTNLLGQVTAVMNSSELEAHNEYLKRLLKNKTWCSYHDLYSWNFKDQKNPELQAPQPEHDILEYLKYNLLPHTVVIDHKTQEISKWASNKKYFLWPLTPYRTHLIECCYKD